MNGNKIPQTSSIQEFADFWDTHDLTDFDAELEEVDEAIFDRQPTVRVLSIPKGDSVRFSILIRFLMLTVNR